MGSEVYTGLRFTNSKADEEAMMDTNEGRPCEEALPHGDGNGDEVGMVQYASETGGEC